MFPLRGCSPPQWSCPPSPMVLPPLQWGCSRPGLPNGCCNGSGAAVSGGSSGKGGVLPPAGGSGGSLRAAGCRGPHLQPVSPPCPSPHLWGWCRGCSGTRGCSLPPPLRQQNVTWTNKHGGDGGGDDGGNGDGGGEDGGAGVNDDGGGGDRCLLPLHSCCSVPWQHSPLLP